ncbi:hypothetical protein PQX77_009631 [Marasmius sp. AFHP31]|nr:hypothetical protein PQX77_009631 [Marasmius sp. AFHP31]
MKKGAVDVVVDVGLKLRASVRLFGSPDILGLTLPVRLYPLFRTFAITFMSQHSLLSSIRYNPVEESDRFENYDILETISHQGSAFVYKAKSIRGRLKGRLVALKKLGSHTANTPSEPLHQGLYHLNIVSLFSTFSGYQHRYHVLELCPGGSLFDILDSCDSDTPTLPEHELLSIARPLIDALSYLKREGIVHRNLNPQSVLFTADRRIKLSNFTHAIRLPSQDTVIDYFIEHPHYSSPELLSREHCDCASDLWSLGVLIFRCHYGELPFQASATRDVIDNILRCRFTIPHQHQHQQSPTLSDLITSLLIIDPTRRPDVHTLLSSSPPTTQSRSKPRPLPYRMPSETRARAPFREIQQNVDLRRILSEEISPAADEVKPIERERERRAVSDPHPQREHGRRSRVKLAPLTAPPGPRGLFNVNVPSSSSLGAGTGATRRQSEDESEPESTTDDHDTQSDTSSTSTSSTILPIGTSRPTPFTTHLLSPRVHKTVNGQITILPSRSVVVDFREGERRRGRGGRGKGKGGEVMVVSEMGREVKIYDAPDLNTNPADLDLDEPRETYELENLPGRFWKAYNDAGVLVGRIKQRTPRMVLYGDHVQSRLMGNGPRGDVELLFTGYHASFIKKTNKIKEETQTQTPTRRVRYSRQTRTLEMSSVQGGKGKEKGKEWKTKTYHVDSGSDALEVSGLDEEEEEAVKLVKRFLRVCREVEGGDGGGVQGYSPATNKDKDKVKVKVEDYVKFAPSETLTGSGSESTLGIRKPLSLSRSLSTIDLARRPVKFSLSSSANSTSNFKYHQDEYVDDSSSSSLGVQSRFIPGIGWCVRHSSRVSQGGRYKIMFLDGAVLDVDADEEWAELVGRDGVRER